MYVFDHVYAEAVSGDGGEHLPRTPPPRQIVGGAPGGDGTEQQLEVIFLGQLLGRRHEGAEFHQNLWKHRTRTVLLQTRWYPIEAEALTAAANFSAAFQALYLDKDFLQECPPVSRGQFLLGLTLTGGLLLDGCWRWWRRRLRCWAQWCLSHVREVEEQVETFDQCGRYGHGGHAVHGFLAMQEWGERRSLTLSPIMIFKAMQYLYTQ